MANIPYGFILWMGLTVIVMLVLRKTKYGRSLYALGNSRGVVFFSGIQRKRVEALAYGVSGMCAALAGMLDCPAAAGSLRRGEYLQCLQ